MNNSSKKREHLTVNMQKEDWYNLLEFLAKLRDLLQHTQEVREGLDEFLNAALQNETATWNMNNIKWTSKEGPSGHYELASEDENKDSKDFSWLIRDLLDHQSKLSSSGYFLWLFADSTKIGRKLQKARTKRHAF